MERCGFGYPGDSATPLHWQETSFSEEKRWKISSGLLFRRSLWSLRSLTTHFFLWFMIHIVFLWCRVTPIVFIHFLASSVFSCVQSIFGDQNWRARLPLLGFLWEAIPHTNRSQLLAKISWCSAENFLSLKRFPLVQLISFGSSPLSGIFYLPPSSQDKVTSLSVQAQLFKRTACPSPALSWFTHLSRGSTPLATLGARARFAELIKNPQF